MDSTTRLIAKSITWQLSGLCVMTLIGYLFTNSISAGGGIAVAAAAVGFISYFMHEMVWSKIGWGRTAAKPARPGRRRSLSTRTSRRRPQSATAA